MESTLVFLKKKKKKKKKTFLDTSCNERDKRKTTRQPRTPTPSFLQIPKSEHCRLKNILHKGILHQATSLFSSPWPSRAQSNRSLDPGFTTVHWRPPIVPWNDGVAAYPYPVSPLKMTIGKTKLCNQRHERVAIVLAPLLMHIHLALTVINHLVPVHDGWVKVALKVVNPRQDHHEKCPAELFKMPHVFVKAEEVLQQQLHQRLAFVILAL
ncbi:hypothetical protein J3459_006329 [Metarhizium acridum]|nr:hypothetical protein J3459_006329 [Metarhizium acridum]